MHLNEFRLVSIEYRKYDEKIATDDKTENLQFNFHTFCAVSEYFLQQKYFRRIFVICNGPNKTHTYSHISYHKNKSSHPKYFFYYLKFSFFFFFYLRCDNSLNRRIPSVCVCSVLKLR